MMIGKQGSKCERKLDYSISKQKELFVLNMTCVFWAQIRKPILQ